MTTDEQEELLTKLVREAQARGEYAPVLAEDSTSDFIECVINVSDEYGIRKLRDRIKQLEAERDELIQQRTWWETQSKTLWTKLAWWKRHSMYLHTQDGD